MKISLTLEVGSVLISLSTQKWRMYAERFVGDFCIWFGPLFFKRSNLPFSREAASRLFNKMNHPDSALRKLTDLYRRKG